MEKRCVSIEIGRIWDSYVFTYLVQLLSKNWKSIGLTTEIESRLGKITDSGFVPGVSQKFFSDMRNYLLSRDYWVDRSGKKQTPQEEDEYAIIFEQNVRVVTVKEGDAYSTKEVVRKKRVEQETFQFGEAVYSLRISNSDEIPISQSQVDDYGKAALNYLQSGSLPRSTRIVTVRHRRRTSFNFENKYVIDMTVTQSGDNLQEALNGDSIYEVECELLMPRDNFALTVFTYLNAILHRLLTQPERICMPPPTSVFHPKNASRLKWASLCPVAVNSDIELTSSKGYSDALIEWCRQQNPENRAILPMKVATQLKWSVAYPEKYYTIRWEAVDMGKQQRDTLQIINQSGTIHTEDGRVFHCCEWQYEGVIPNNLVAPIKRQSSAQ